MKPHNFNIKLSMDSTSEDVTNQTVLLDLTEYASTGGELTLKQMTFTKEALPKILDAIIQAFDSMSQPWQEQGLKDAAEEFEKVNGRKPQ